MEDVNVVVVVGISSNSGSTTMVSKDDNLVLSSEDSSYQPPPSPPHDDDDGDDESRLQLGLSLTLSPPPSHHHRGRISPSSSSSSPAVLVGTKRNADSFAAVNNAPSQVVGWPPLRAYRMNSFNSNSKSAAATEVFNSMAEKSKTLAEKGAEDGNDNNINIKEKRQLRSSSFVKVNMDGMQIGRKVDLSAHSSYETLAQTLEDMFNESTTAITCKGSNGDNHGIIVGIERHSKLLDGSSKFVLTYEDKEGDWMLVGDVPWGMFLSSVKRLRIMRTSEDNGLAPRFEGKNSRLKSNPI
ncbi:hypothetical protein RIF29_20121 [Crotalaria pallida]|uniref:Auxin-induced protein n=1 Tax=Crotalaria pallida TaxID=3830 RepID=A0AAN9F122_CROPI